jgi:hypothetical protein
VSIFPKLTPPVLLLVSGCSLPLESETLPFENSCAETAECGAGAACVSAAGRKVCAATKTDLGPVYLEVQATNVSGSSTSFLFTGLLELQGEHPGGVLVAADLQLPSLVEVTGSYEALPGTPESCMAPQGGGVGTVPVKVELRARTPLPGVENRLSAISALVAGVHTFQVDAPPGTYDVYVTPQEQPDCETPPPRFFPAGLVVPSDVGKIKFAPRAEEPRTVTGTITVPQDQPLVGWQLDVIDPAYGKVVSDSITLGEPVDATVAFPPIPYSYTDDALIRLRDPDGDLEVHWLLESVDFYGTGEVQLYLGDLEAVPLEMTGTVVGPGKTGPIAGASVTIQSKQLTGSANQNATYKLVTQSGDTGGITVKLVPGTYLVSVVPPTPGMGTFFGEWEITPTGGGNGKGFELPLQPVLEGAVSTAGGEAVANAAVLVSPSQTVSSTYFSRIFEPLTPLPRQLTGTLGDTGGLQLAVDPGTLDFSIQTDAESGFPWLVRPRLVVQGADQTPSLDLGEVKVPYPVVVVGSVQSATGKKTPSALIRAWIPSGAGDVNAADAPLVLIGSTIADEDGSFFLPLPPTVTKSE